MQKKHYAFYLAGNPRDSDNKLAVSNKFSQEIAATVALADQNHIDEAIAKAEAVRKPMQQLKAYQRQAVLEHCVTRFKQRQEELTESLSIEAGKPIRDARGEVARLIDTFRIAAEEAVRLYGEVQPMDISERAANYQSSWRRFPIGVCSFISPFNFPLNLAAHKIAPAIACGCPFILKPASLTPIGALMIGEVLAETDLPKGAFSILPCRREDADLFTTDERLKLLSFTGSPEVGWALKAKSGKKKVILELGGNAAVIIDETWHDIDAAVNRIIIGAFYQSGQSCIGVQRILIHESIYKTVKDKLIEKSRQLIKGDPMKEDTFIGPLITEGEAKRLKSWISAALDRGATLLCGGHLDGSLLDATLLEDVPQDEKLVQEEAFGPVAILSSFHDFNQALDQVNGSRFGLQAGIFTRDLYRAQQAWETLEVGGVMIGDVPSYRADNMPYGGVKDSGLGREGIRFAMEDMTEIRHMTVRMMPSST